MRRRICLVQTGEAAQAVRRTQGDYDRFFVRHLARLGVAVRLVRAHLGERVDGGSGEPLILTGSRLSMTEPAPWMQRLAEDVRTAAERGTPVLGVCFGHQLLGHAWHVRVERSPRGREIGTVPVRLTEAGRRDPLFAGVPDTFWAQTTHEDEVPRLPSSAVALATNGHSALQAMAIGEHVRGVQFHPELDAAALAALAHARADTLGPRLRDVLASLGPTPAAERVLSNFVERFVPG